MAHSATLERRLTSLGREAHKRRPSALDGAGQAPAATCDDRRRSLRATTAQVAAYQVIAATWGWD